jgi:peptidyl-prolyl cis-trans isomerase SurA
MKKIILAALLSLFTMSAKAASVNIIAIVNGDIITNEDIESRVNLFVMNTNIPLNPQTENMIRNRVLHNTIDERLRIQDAERVGITITDQEVSAAIANFERSSNFKSGELRSKLREHRVSDGAFREHMRSELAWLRVIRRRTGEIHITQREVDRALEEAKRDLATPKFLVSEIFIRRENAKDLDGLVARLREDPRFELYAMQFSESPSASSGGNLGWVNKGKFLPPLEAALSRMKVGEISRPIRVGDDFYILRLNSTFDPKKDKSPEPTEDSIRTWLENRRMEEFAANHLQRLRQTAVIEIKQN